MTCVVSQCISRCHIFRRPVGIANLDRRICTNVRDAGVWSTVIGSVKQRTGRSTRRNARKSPCPLERKRNKRPSLEHLQFCTPALLNTCTSVYTPALLNTYTFVLCVKSEIPNKSLVLLCFTARLVLLISRVSMWRNLPRTLMVLVFVLLNSSWAMRF